MQTINRTNSGRGFKCVFCSGWKYSHGNQCISCFQPDRETQFGWEQVEFFPVCESFFLWLPLQSLVEILMQHTLFFLVLCFAQNPVKWATWRMTKLVNRPVFFKVVDFGWKSWFCLFALIKYRWITWAADNLLSPRKKKNYFIPLSIMKALPTDREKGQVKTVSFSPSWLVKIW